MSPSAQPGVIQPISSLITDATLVTLQRAPLETPFLSFADQGMYLAYTAGAQQAVIQSLWRYRRPVDLAALERFHQNLGQGVLARLIRPARVPFGRHQWVNAAPLSSALDIPATALPPDALQAWTDAQVELPLDPVAGPAWRLSLQTFTDGSTMVSLVVSHCIADGTLTAIAVSEAARGERRALPYPVTATQTHASSMGAELLRVLQDAPDTFKALGHLARKVKFFGADRGSPKKLPEKPPEVTSANDAHVFFPSAFVRVPLSVWDETAKSLGANRLTLLSAVTLSFADALGRVQDAHATLLMPVNRREGASGNDANCVSLATLKVPTAEARGRLHGLKRRLQATLLKSRREPDPLDALLPLVPFVPKRAFSMAGDLAFESGAAKPVTCSNMGELPAEVMRIDGMPSDLFCFRGVDRQVSCQSIEARGGVATLLAASIPNYLVLNFVAYQPGLVVEHVQLKHLVEKTLNSHGITGEHFGS